MGSMHVAGASVSSDRRHFFMSSAQLEALEHREELERDPVRQKLGAPIRAGARILGFELAGGDAAVLALASHQARVADLATGECGAEAARHAGPVTAVAVLGSNYRVGGSRVAVSGSWDKTIRVWAVDRPYQTLAVLAGHADFVKCLAAHPTLPIVYSGSADKTIKYWRLPASLDAPAGAPPAIAPFKTVAGQHTGQILALCLDAGAGRTLYSTGSDASVRAWDALTGAAQPGAGGEAWCIARGQHKTNVVGLAATETELWTCSADTTAVSWDIETGGVDLVLQHSAPVTAVLPIPPAGVVVTGVRDGAIYVWRVSTGSPEIIREIHAHTDDVTCLRAAGRAFYSAALDQTLRRWDVRDVVDFAGGREFVPAELAAVAAAPAASAPPAQSMLTEEEERELAELMSDLDDA